MAERTIGVIGCGNMGSVLVEGLVKNGLYPSSSIYISDVKKEKLKGFRLSGVHIVDNRELTRSVDVIIIAVKPDVVGKVISEIKSLLTPKKILISIAAGVPTRKIERLIGKKKVPVIRVMPNVNAKVKSGILTYCLGRYADGYERLIEKIFAPLGTVLKLQESKFDIITAISGSGPGFIFYIAENLKRICKEKKLTEKQASLITSYLIYGAGKMLVETGLPPDRLRSMVTSPGGTTIAGLEVFEQARFPDILKQVINSAEKRSRELSRG
jgi:pyrroline-5-carboxylate reductase